MVSLGTLQRFFRLRRVFQIEGNYHERLEKNLNQPIFVLFYLFCVYLSKRK